MNYKYFLIVLTMTVSGCQSTATYNVRTYRYDNKLNCDTANLVKHSIPTGTKQEAYIEPHSGGGIHYYLTGDKNEVIARNIIKECASSHGGRDAKQITHFLRNCSVNFASYDFWVYLPNRSYETSKINLSCSAAGLKSSEDAFDLYKDSTYINAETTSDK